MVDFIGQRSNRRFKSIDIDQRVIRRTADFILSENRICAARGRLAGLAASGDAMALFLYHCPNTSLQVQGFVEDDDADNKGRREIYCGEDCPACGKLHFVNPTSGKVLGVRPTGTAGKAVNSGRMS